MSVNKYNATTGELISLAGGTRTWIGTKAAYEAQKTAGTLPTDVLIIITDDEEQTEAEQISYDNTDSSLVADNVQDAIDEITKAVASATNYSTTEVDTGRVWLDGKKIYRKGIIATKATGANILELITGVSSVISVRGVLKSGEGYYYNIPYAEPNAGSGAGQFIGVQVDPTHKARLIAPDNKYGSGTVELVLEYTKST